MAYGPGQYDAPPMYQSQPMYQPQQYGYQSPGAPCPPAQPISPSALSSTPPQAMPGAASGGTAPQPMPGGPGTTPAQPAATHTVTAQDDLFEPKTLNIQPGATVTWVNRGKHAHTVTFDVGRDSGDIVPGGSFSATFPHAGTYQYHCHHHPDMKGTVVVGQTSGSGSAGSTTGAKY
jgi:plastocyanin